MGGSCSCLQTPSSLALNSCEVNYIISESYQDLEKRPNLIIELQDAARITQLSKRYITGEYIKSLKNPEFFHIPHEFFLESLKSIESPTIKTTEHEYGEYRTTPI